MKLRKILAGILAFSMSVAYMTGVLAEENEGVEISFKVGDDTLLINGSAVTVEKPFVAGEGTTLVPLRVITEAFGATVDWEDATQKITLTYPDVAIVLQIGNGIAQVNDHAETLLEAPVLMNDTTMVPLRFISETFGAEVSYDEATEGITVKKQAMTENDTVKGMTELEKVGDSYYGWVMNTPNDFLMADRSFDGSYTYFEDESGNSIEVEVYKLDEDVSFDEYFGEVKESFSGSTLVKADKLTDKYGNKYMHFQSKYSGSLCDLRLWMYNCYEISIYTELIPEVSEEVKNSCFAIADSFSVKGIFDDTVYDLSDVENGYREFKLEEYKLSFKVPADFYRISYGMGENEILLTDYGQGEKCERAVRMSIYSKSVDVTAQKLAISDRESHYKYSNKDIVTVSEVEEIALGEISGWQYTKKTENVTYESEVLRDIFFDLGEYVYNFTLSFSNKDDMEQVDEIANSLKAEELETAVIGTMLRNDPEQVDKKVKNDKWSISIPPMWEQPYSASQQGVVLTNKVSDGVATVIMAYNQSITAGSMLAYFKGTVEEYAKSNDMSIVSPMKSVTLGKNTFYKSILKKEDKDGVSYETVYFGYIKGTLISFDLIESEVYYSGDIDTEFENIVKSFELL